MLLLSVSFFSTTIVPISYRVNRRQIIYFVIESHDYWLTEQLDTRNKLELKWYWFLQVLSIRVRSARRTRNPRLLRVGKVVFPSLWV